MIDKTESATVKPDLQEVQEERLGQAPLLDERHGVGEVVDVVAVHVENHRLGELEESQEQTGSQSVH